MLKKLSENISLKTEVEVDYLSTLTRLLLRYYYNQPIPVENDPASMQKLANDLINALSNLCLIIKARLQPNSTEPEAPNERT